MQQASVEGGVYVAFLVLKAELAGQVQLWLPLLLTSVSAQVGCRGKGAAGLAAESGVMQQAASTLSRICLQSWLLSRA
jgi:hypothetical protein